MHLLERHARELFQGGVVRHLVNVGEPDVLDAAVLLRAFFDNERAADKDPALAVFKIDNDELQRHHLHGHALRSVKRSGLLSPAARRQNSSPRTTPAVLLFSA